MKDDPVAMHIAMVGTRGVPACYGGFETCVEEVGRRLAARGHKVTVYCRSADSRRRSHLGMNLVHLPAVRRRSLETLSHTTFSVAHVARTRPDVVIVFNAANAPLLPVLRSAGIPFATHVDGLEWKRSKWGGAGKRYYRMAEQLAVRWSDALIADAQGIADYYEAEFGAPTELISYGAPIIAPEADRLTQLGLAQHRFHLAVARFEPENHLHLIIEGYRRSGCELPLVVVGAAPYADEYTRRLHSLADGRVRFLGAVWDQELLDQLYANCLSYLHGHSVGGTNPSLLRAMGAGAPSSAFDVTFNREVLGHAGTYFSTAADVTHAVEDAEVHPELQLSRGASAVVQARRYDWDEVADRYEVLCRGLAATGQRTGRPTGRRTSETVLDAPVPAPVGDLPVAGPVHEVPVAAQQASVVPETA